MEDEEVEKEEKERQRKEELRAREELKRAETAMGIKAENINPGKDDWETRKRSSPQKIGNKSPQNRWGNFAEDIGANQREILIW